MKKITKLFAVFTIALSVLAVSCGGSNQPKEELQGIELRFSSGRSILPVADLNDLTDVIVTGIDEDGEETVFGRYDYISSITGFLPVKVGLWDIVVTANRGITEFKATAENVEVVSNSVTPVDLNFEFNRYGEVTNGYGSINLILEYPGNDVAEVKAYLEASSGYLVDSDFFTPVNNKAQIIFDDVDSGYYYLTVFFYGENGAYINTFRDYVIVTDGCVSELEYSIPKLNELHSITYELNGGEFANIAGLHIPSSFANVIDFTLPSFGVIRKDYYIFNGWYTDPDFAPSSLITGWLAGEQLEDITVYAKWDPVEYLVSYFSLGGTDLEGNLLINRIYTVESEPFELPEVKKDYYEFAGWYSTYTYDEDSLITEIDVTNPSDIHLYAKWNTKEYPITWNLRDSSMDVSKLNFEAPEQTCFTIEDPIDITIPNATYPGYILVGWNIEQVSADSTVKTYSDIYYPNDSFYESTIEDEATSFVVSAIWDKSPVTVSFESDYNIEVPAAILLHNESVLDTTANKTVPSELLSILTDEATGFRSLGWYKKGDSLKTPVTPTTTFDSNTVLVANWKNRYEVSYASAYVQDMLPDSFIVEEGTILTGLNLPTLTDTTYQFNSEYWYVAQDVLKTPVASGYIVTSDIELTASWKSRYTVTYDVNGEAIATPKTITVEEGTYLNQSMLPGLGYSGMAVEGWYLSTETEADLIAPNTTQISENITLVAKWVPGWRITYVSDYVTAPQTAFISKGGALTEGLLPELEVSGWVHKGWNYSNDTLAQVGDIVTEDIILTAYWYDMCTVKYESDYVTSVPDSFEVDVNGFLTEEQLMPVTDPLTGFENAYWYFKNDPEKTPITTTTPVTKDVTIVAAWRERYTISYSTEYETAPESKVVEDGYVITKADLPILTTALTTDYFGGWYYGSLRIKKGFTVAYDLDLIALWDSDAVCNITYQSERGIVPAPANIPLKNALEEEDLPTLTENGYFFVGWYDKDDVLAEPDEYYLDTDMIFTAKWARSGAKVTIAAGETKTIQVSLNYAVPYIVTLLTDDCEIDNNSMVSVNNVYTTSIDEGKKYETINTSLNNGKWTSSMNVSNNNPTKAVTAVIIADFNTVNDVPYEITSTVSSTALEDLFRADTNSVNHYRVSYEMHVAAGSKLYCQWYDSFNKLTSLGSVNWGDQYLYVYDAATGTRIGYNDDQSFSVNVPSTTTDLIFIVGGRTNTCTSYFRPYIMN